MDCEAPGLSGSPAHDPGRRLREISWRLNSPPYYNIAIEADFGRLPSMRIGWTEILVILGILLLLFGAKKLPELARSLGKSFKEFKKGIHEEGEEKKEERKP